MGAGAAGLGSSRGTVNQKVLPAPALLMLLTVDNTESLRSRGLTWEQAQQARAAAGAR